MSLKLIAEIRIWLAFQVECIKPILILSAICKRVEHFRSYKSFRIYSLTKNNTRKSWQPVHFFILMSVPVWIKIVHNMENVSLHDHNGEKKKIYQNMKKILP